MLLHESGARELGQDEFPGNWNVVGSGLAYSEEAPLGRGESTSPLKLRLVRENTYGKSVKLQSLLYACRKASS